MICPAVSIFLNSMTTLAFVFCRRLRAPGCPDTDWSGTPRASPIHSDDALAVTMSTFGQWQTFFAIRPDAPDLCER